MRFAMIMAGGSGTRLWPISRGARPKQMIRFIQRPGGPVSLLELAAGRLTGVVPAERQLICTAEAYRPAIRELLPDFADERILGEPAPRDTVNAVGLTAAVLLSQDPEAIFAVLTSDHVIEPEAVFREKMDLAFGLVEEDPSRFVTFSITPTHAATGYGYIERGAPLFGSARAIGPNGKPVAHKVARFVEKPQKHVAQAYFESGVFGWNAGMFVWKASSFMAALARFKPESHAGLTEIARTWGTPARRDVLARVYPALPRISVDYAVLEPAARDKQFTICAVPMDVTWLDVGSWPSFAKTVAPDAENNRRSGPGSAVIVGGQGNLVVSDDPGHTIAMLGCQDLIVVRTADATLIMPASRAEELKDLHARLPDSLTS